jgi:glyoxylase-like metal-dependent hydrolase (beta-lactamase superfamily II)
LRIPPEVNDYLQNDGWEKVRLLEDEAEVLPGIRAFWTGVHHRSSIAVSIETAKGTALITDCFFKYGNLEQGHYLGVMESMMEADAAWKRIRREGKLIASVYDPEVFQRYPGGVLA